MEHSPEHHIEEAEHAQHAARDPFDRRVTMSIAIVAAILACITMLGHREHNATLLLQGEAIQLQSQAGIVHSREANKWNYFQATKFRQHLYDANQEMLEEMLTALNQLTPSKAVKRWKEQVTKYQSRLPKEEKIARDLEEEVQKLQKEAVAKLRE